MHITEMINQYERSVNIHKITDGEYIDKYVEMYLWLENVSKCLKSYRNLNNVNSDLVYYGTSKDNILYVTCDKYSFTSLIKHNLYITFINEFNIPNDFAIYIIRTHFKIETSINISAGIDINTYLIEK